MWYRRLLCPVMIPTRIERDPLFFRISLSVLVLSKDGHSFLVMLHVSMDFHLRFASLMANFPASSLSVQGGLTGVNGLFIQTERRF